MTGPILTLGLGAFAGSQFLPTLGYGTGATPPVPTRQRGSIGRQQDTIRRDDEELMLLAAAVIGAIHAE